MNTIVRLDRERALRLARVVRSWHRADDEAGALDCFVGMVRGELSDDELADIWWEIGGNEHAMRSRLEPWK
jgi:molybdopterin synthase catalytic subunit